MVEISSLESRNVLKNFVKMGVSAIAYLRNLFDESVFEDATIGGMPLKKLTKAIRESETLLDWIDYGIYDALAKGYLKDLIISIHDESNKVLESYIFNFQYQDGNSKPRVHMSTDKNGETEATECDIQRNGIKTQTIKMLRDLILLIQSLSPLSENCFISMKLFYRENVPEDYEPRYFRKATSSERAIEDQFYLKQKLGWVNTGHHDMTISVNSSSYIDEFTTSYKSTLTLINSEVAPDDEREEADIMYEHVSTSKTIGIQPIAAGNDWGHIEEIEVRGGTGKEKYAQLIEENMTHNGSIKNNVD